MTYYLDILFPCALLIPPVVSSNLESFATLCSFILIMEHRLIYSEIAGPILTGSRKRITLDNANFDLVT